MWLYGDVNGVHDLGGTDGFGPVPHTPQEPVFHEAWEGRAFALVAAGGMHGLYRTAEFRHAIERIDPLRYLASTYYERWLGGLATLLVEKGVVSAEELEEAAGGSVPLSGPVRAPHVPSPPADVTEPRFGVGDAVRVRNAHPRGHTRCPRYVRGRTGAVVRSDGPVRLDDVEAHGTGTCMDPLYGIAFEGAELWGEHAEPGVTVHVDLFESHLEVP